MLFYGRNQHSIVNQLSPIKLFFEVWVFHFILGYTPLWGSGFDDKTYVEWQGLLATETIFFVCGLDQFWKQNHHVTTKQHVTTCNNCVCIQTRMCGCALYTYMDAHVYIYMGGDFPGGSEGKESVCQCRRCGFNSWVRKIPWRRKWLPPPLFLPGKFHRQRSLAGYSPWGLRESDTTEWLSFHASMCLCIHVWVFMFPLVVWSNVSNSHDLLKMTVGFCPMKERIGSSRCKHQLLHAKPWVLRQPDSATWTLWIGLSQWEEVTNQKGLLAYNKDGEWPLRGWFFILFDHIFTTFDHISSVTDRCQLSGSQIHLKNVAGHRMNSSLWLNMF